MQSKKKNDQKLFYLEKVSYVQKYTNESDKNFDSTQDNEATFSSSFFHEGIIVNVETIE